MKIGKKKIERAREEYLGKIRFIVSFDAVLYAQKKKIELRISLKGSKNVSRKRKVSRKNKKFAKDRNRWIRNISLSITR